MKKTAALLLLLVASVAAQADDWQTKMGDGGLPYMYTISDAGNLFGKWCDAKTDSCFWLLFSNVPCDKDASLPVLINAGKRVLAAEVTCTGEHFLSSKRYHRYVFSDPDKLDTLIPDVGGKVSIAMAIEDDQFRVLRFTGKGLSAAYREWLAAVQQYNRRTGATTKDSTL